MKRWWLDELAYAGPEHLDEGYVAGYDRKSGPDPVDDVAVLRSYGLAEASAVVDMAAGTGRFALAVAPYCQRVTAVDVSPAMVEYLRSAVERAGLGNVEIVHGGFLSYEHRGEAVDFVYSRNALHQLPDFWKGIALQRIASMLRPGGVFRVRDLIFDFEPVEADERIEAWLAGAVDDSRDGWTADELAEHVRTEFSTFSWVFEAMLERAGFEVEERAFRKSVYGSYVCRLAT